MLRGIEFIFSRISEKSGKHIQIKLWKILQQSFTIYEKEIYKLLF